MKERIARLKQKIEENQVALAFAAGSVTTGVAAVIIGKKLNLTLGREHPAIYSEIFLAADNEVLQRLIDEPDGMIQWTHVSGAVVNVINEANQ